MAAIWAILRSGTGVVPGAEWHFAATFDWPSRPINPDEWYLADSPLGILIAKAIGVETLSQFLQLHLLAVLLFMAGLALWALFITDDTAAKWQAARLSLLAPTSAILLTWIGRYDAFTALAWVIALGMWCTQKRTLLIAAGLLLGVQHFEHSLMGALVLSSTWMALQSKLPDRLRHTNPSWLIPGIIAGKLVLVAMFAANGMPISGRVGWLDRFFFDWTVTAISILPLLAWSLFAGWWAVATSLYLDASTRSRQLLIAAFTIGLIATILSGDRPRVFILVVLPALPLASVAFAKSTHWDTKRRRLVEVIAWLAPPLIFWGDEVTNVNVVDSFVILVKEMLDFV